MILSKDNSEREQARKEDTDQFKNEMCCNNHTKYFLLISFETGFSTNFVFENVSPRSLLLYVVVKYCLTSETRALIGDDFESRISLIAIRMRFVSLRKK